MLDPDGDIVRYLKATKAGRLDPAWACYHSELHRFEQGALEFGIVGCAVGASYAVLVAEQIAGAVVFLLTLLVFVMLAKQPELAENDLFKTLAQAVVVQGLVGLAMAAWFTTKHRDTCSDRTGRR